MMRGRLELAWAGALVQAATGLLWISRALQLVATGLIAGMALCRRAAHALALASGRATARATAARFE